MDEPSKFPAVYRSYSSDDLIEAFERGPARLGEVLEGLDEEEIRSRPIEGKWSIQEIVVHLADAEIMGAIRFRQVVSAPGSVLPVYEQDDWSAAFDYQGATAQQRRCSLDLYTALRATSAPILRRAGDEDWQLACVHPEWGRLTMRDLLELYADHGERHLEQILRLRQILGNPLEFPLLLETRLY